MWYCSSCGYENKDEYRFCLGCGTPRPQPEPEPEPPRPAVKQAPKRAPLTQEERRGGVALAVLLLFALLLIGAVAAVLLKLPLFAPQQPEDIPEGTVNARHISDPGPTESPESGGTSSYVFGTDELVPAAPSPEATPEPTPTPLPTPTPAPTPTVDPEYLIPGSDSRYITEADLADLSREQIMLARNEIYARHGRIFETPEIASYFNAKSWYHGTVDPRSFSESVFNAYENANINLIRQYEIAHWGG